VFVRFP
jgi:branched-chain amino acid transport system ATP-binding protein